VPLGDSRRYDAFRSKTATPSAIDQRHLLQAKASDFSFGPAAIVMGFARNPCFRAEGILANPITYLSTRTKRRAETPLRKNPSVHVAPMGITFWITESVWRNVSEIAFASAPPAVS